MSLPVLIYNIDPRLLRSTPRELLKGEFSLARMRKVRRHNLSTSQAQSLTLCCLQQVSCTFDPYGLVLCVQPMTVLAQCHKILWVVAPTKSKGYNVIDFVRDLHKLFAHPAQTVLTKRDSLLHQLSKPPSPCRWSLHLVVLVCLSYECMEFMNTEPSTIIHRHTLCDEKPTRNAPPTSRDV